MAALLKIAGPVANFAKALRHRREIMLLAELDDRMLKDIGLSRADVDSALAEPFFHNPSVVLVRCAERHTRAERLARSSRKARPVVSAVMRNGSYA
jgi:uncharacterized protein YjiS (DUF1127 family)